MSVRDTPLLNILSWCRNVTLRSSFYPGTETWHPIHILSWYRNMAPDPYTILVPERDTRSPNLSTFVHQSFFYTKASSLTSRLGFLFKIWDSIASSCLFIHNYIITSFMQAYNQSYRRFTILLTHIIRY